MAAPSPEMACALLESDGFRVPVDRIRIESREDRWMAFLPNRLLAWFPSSSEGHARLAIERRILGLIAERCSFRAPRVLHVDPRGEFDVREMIPGNAGPMEVLSHVTANRDLAVRVGRAIGSILAEQHSKIFAVDIEGLIPRQPGWPGSRSWIMERLRVVVENPRLLGDADVLLGIYEGIPIPESDRALVHTDVGFHNMGIDAKSWEVSGLFDYGDAAWADRHHDFRYLIYDVGRFDLLDAAVDAYQALGGGTIQRRRVLLYNAACALMFLAYRMGAGPEELSCGRTLSEDLRWSTQAVGHALKAWERGNE